MCSVHIAKLIGQHTINLEIFSQILLSTSHLSQDLPATGLNITIDKFPNSVS